jgi:hypothetical protein|tara:strand:- start:453 stop:833 length:381 start_codon:yes stop_codon:yes gene_type:complete
MATRTFTFDTDSDYPPVSDLVVNVGASFTCTYTVTTPSGSAYDFTGFTTSSAQMAKHVGTAATQTFTVGFSSALDGKIFIGLTTTQTDALTDGRYKYDVNVRSGVGTVYRLVEGDILVRGGISSTL